MRPFPAELNCVRSSQAARTVVIGAARGPGAGTGKTRPPVTASWIGATVVSARPGSPPSADLLHPPTCRRPVHSETWVVRGKNATGWSATRGTGYVRCPAPGVKPAFLARAVSHYPPSSTWSRPAASRPRSQSPRPCRCFACPLPYTGPGRKLQPRGRGAPSPAPASGLVTAALQNGPALRSNPRLFITRPLRLRSRRRVRPAVHHSGADQAAV